jgi:hypothetical protein
MILRTFYRIKFYLNGSGVMQYLEFNSLLEAKQCLSHVGNTALRVMLFKVIYTLNTTTNEITSSEQQLTKW